MEEPPTATVFCLQRFEHGLSRGHPHVSYKPFQTQSGEGSLGNTVGGADTEEPALRNLYENKILPADLHFYDVLTVEIKENGVKSALVTINVQQVTIISVKAN